MKEIVYILCAITSFGCAYLLFKAHRKQPSQLLLWSWVSFAGLCLNNVLLYIDLVLGPDYDLNPYRLAVILISVSLLIFGLIWDVV